MLLSGIEKDIEADSRNAAAVKNIALAQIHIVLGKNEAAISAADSALDLSGRDSIRIAAAGVFMDVGNTDRASRIAEELTSKLQSQSRAYGQMIQASIARADGRYVEAIDLLRSAIDLADLWLIRFELGRAYLDAEYFAEALDEFNECKKRRGEATAVFLDDTPSIRYMSTLPYWTALAQQALGMQSSAAQEFAAFLALRPQGGPLAEDARQRVP